MKALIIDTPHIDNILQGKKTWEMRSSRTRIRGLITLIRMGSGAVVGIARLVDATGPLTTDEMLATEAKHLIRPDRLALPEVAKYRYAWILEDARAISPAVPYQHPPGAVIWVNLDAAVTERACRSLPPSLA
jgi:hypothetical protein